MKRKDYDYLIVGSGLYGATFAYLARLHGKRCLVVERRKHAGGNVYCERMAGINVHKYGAHIFHTSDCEVWRLVNSIVEMNRYTNSPVAFYKGSIYNLPFNMNTFHQMWGVVTPQEAQAKIEEQRQDALCRMREQGISEPRNLEEQAIVLIGQDIYETLIKGYTEKQWGRRCTELPAFIIKRLPVRLVFDNNYSNDLYQGIPVGGYNKLIERLLEGVELRLDCDYLAQRDELNDLADKVVYTGALDEYYGYCFGPLQYRSIRLDTEVIDTPNYQGNAVVNYTDRDVPYTRVIEHKHFEMFGDEVHRVPQTVISREYSTEWHQGMEPYYPVNDERNTTLYSQYHALTTQEPRLLIGGRLADYRYYDMAPTIRKAMEMAKRELQ